MCDKWKKEKAAMCGGLCSQLRCTKWMNVREDWLVKARRTRSKRRHHHFKLLIIRKNGKMHGGVWWKATHKQAEFGMQRLMTPGILM